MTIKLTPMNQETFDQYYKQSVKEYAEEHVRAGNWKEDEALSQAELQFKQFLPDGLATKEHVLFTVIHEEEKIGVLWLHVQSSRKGKPAFIFDIKLDRDQRGKGFGKATMNALEEYARSEGIKEIRLHVFAHNRRAIALYENMGYEMTDHQMLKRLT